MSNPEVDFVDIKNRVCVIRTQIVNKYTAIFLSRSGDADQCCL